MTSWSAIRFTRPSLSMGKRCLRKYHGARARQSGHGILVPVSFSYSNRFFLCRCRAFAVIQFFFRSALSKNIMARGRVKVVTEFLCLYVASMPARPFWKQAPLPLNITSPWATARGKHILTTKWFSQNPHFLFYRVDHRPRLCCSTF